jgi:hypothetical protein
LAAVARILEELGEVAEHARKEQQPGELTDACLEEVADLLIVSTCLANQYSVNLAAEYAVAPLSSEQGLVPNLIRALTVAGSISRVVKLSKELNRRGYSTRDGRPWTKTALFNLMPRMIQVGPRVFSS